LSRRALVGLGGTTLLMATAATAWRWRSSRVGPPPRAAAPIAYADHDGWMVSLAEKQALRAQPGDPAAVR
jgi:hypothetical protein